MLLRRAFRGAAQRLWAGDAGAWEPVAQHASPRRSSFGRPAPEQVQGQPRPASDQYALGIVVYEWLCGSPPFHGTPLELAMQHLSAPPPPLRARAPELSPGGRGGSAARARQRPERAISYRGGLCRRPGRGKPGGCAWTSRPGTGSANPNPS